MTIFAYVALPVAEASAWVEEPGEVRVSVGLQATSSRRQFAPGDARGLTGPLCPVPIGPGDRMPYSCVTGGRFVHTGLLLDAAAGLLPWLTADLAVPVVLHAAFEDGRGRTVASGLGDLRVGLRAGRSMGPWAGAVGLRVEVPTGPTAFLERDLPLGDGQFDLVPAVAAGASLWPWGWLETHQGFAIRLHSPLTEIDPGDEWVADLGGGFTPIERAGVLARTGWRWALPDRSAFGLPVPGRRVLEVHAGLFARPVDPLWIEAGVTWPVAGRRWIAAPTWSAAVAWRFRRDQRAATESSAWRICSTEGRSL